jgi:hypothetical protein
MKRGPFAPGGLCCPADHHYYRPLRLPLGRPPLPGIAGYRRASLPATPQATGPRRLSPVPRTTIRTFNAQYAGGFLSARFWIPGAFRGLRRRLTGSAPSLPARRRSLDDACSGFTHVADRTVAHAPLRTRPLDHARGHHYRGPGRLPGPDSHRQAAPTLSLGYVMNNSFLFTAPEQSGRTSGRREACRSFGPKPAAPGCLPPPFEPCVRFSRTRLTDIVHRRACADHWRTVPVRRWTPSWLTHP